MADAGLVSQQHCSDHGQPGQPATLFWSRSVWSASNTVHGAFLAKSVLGLPATRLLCQQHHTRCYKCDVFKMVLQHIIPGWNQLSRSGLAVRH